MLRKIALPFFFGMVVLILIVDAVIAGFGGNGSTISAQLWTLSHIYPAIPFFFGLLCGHLFIPAEGDKA